MSAHRNGFDRGTVTVPAGEPALYDAELTEAAGSSPSAPTGRGPVRA
ncbi:hypothetical protein ACIRBZ_29620 [Streptomyces sp. NPDC094038]